MQVILCDICGKRFTDEMKKDFSLHNQKYKVDFCSDKCRNEFFESLYENFPE